MLGLFACHGKRFTSRGESVALRAAEKEKQKRHTNKKREGGVGQSCVLCVFWHIFAFSLMPHFFWRFFCFCLIPQQHLLFASTSSRWRHSNHLATFLLRSHYVGGWWYYQMNMETNKGIISLYILLCMLRASVYSWYIVCSRWFQQLAHHWHVCGCGWAASMAANCRLHPRRFIHFTTENCISTKIILRHGRRATEERERNKQSERERERRAFRVEKGETIFACDSESGHRNKKYLLCDCKRIVAGPNEEVPSASAPNAWSNYSVWSAYINNFAAMLYRLGLFVSVAHYL